MENTLAANPDSAQAARDVMVSHWKLSELYRTRGDEPAAAEHRGKCLPFWIPLPAWARPMDAPMRRLYEQLKPEFGGGAPQ